MDRHCFRFLSHDRQQEDVDNIGHWPYIKTASVQCRVYFAQHNIIQHNNIQRLRRWPTSNNQLLNVLCLLRPSVISNVTKG